MEDRGVLEGERLLEEGGEVALDVPQAFHESPQLRYPEPEKPFAADASATTSPDKDAVPIEQGGQPTPSEACDLSDLSLADKISTLPEDIGMKILDHLVGTKVKSDFAPLSTRILRLFNKEWKQRVGKQVSKFTITGVDELENLKKPSIHQTFPNIKRLDFTSFPSIQEEDIEAVIANFPDLKELCFAHDLRNLPNNIGSLQSLQKLDLSYTNLTRLPNTIRDLQSLRELDMGGCKMIPGADLVRIAGIPQLQTLKLSQTQITAASLTWILRRHKNLEKLSLFGCSDLHSLPEAIGGLKHLKSLEIGANRNIPDADFAHIAGLSQLQELDLIYTQITSASLTRILRSHKKLEKLSLSGCSGLHSLPEAIGGLEHLKELTLRNCKNIPSADFYALEGLKSLKELGLRDTYIPDAVITVLERQNPDMQLFR